MGARVLEQRVTRRENVKPSEFNPEGLEQRVYLRYEIRDVSLTARPEYETSVTIARSSWRPSDPRMIYGRFEPVDFRPLRRPDYLADELLPRDYLSEGDFL